MNEHYDLSVEQILGYTSHRLGFEDFDNLWNFQDSWAGDDGKANALWDGDLEAFFVVEEVKLVEIQVEAVLSEEEKFELLGSRLCHRNCCESS